jgi:hypothetical protein
MTNALRVTVLKSTDNLSVDPSGIVFIHPSVRLGLKEPVSGAPRHVFHHQNYLLFSLYGFV